MKIFNKLVAVGICFFIGFVLTAPDVNAANIGFTLKDGPEAIVTIDGVIEVGDHSKFTEVVRNAFQLATGSYLVGLEKGKQDSPEELEKFKSEYGDIGGLISIKVSLNSNGGSVSEAIKIGRDIRRMALKTVTADPDENSVSCNGACFFIWVSGVDRATSFVNKKSPIGIHRIYFDKEHYKDLSSTDAEKQYLEVKSASIKYLHEMGVSESIINKIFKTPSYEVYMLDESELDSLEGIVPYYDELLISRCGTISEKEEDDFIMCKVIVPAIENGSWEYEISKVRKKSFFEQCNAFSSGYLNYLDKVYSKTNECRKTHDKIEQWKRIAIHLSYNHLIPE